MGLRTLARTRTRVCVERELQQKPLLRVCVSGTDVLFGSVGHDVTMLCFPLCIGVGLRR